LLSNEGYTVRGVQKLLRDQPKSEAPNEAPPPAPVARPDPAMFTADLAGKADIDVERLVRLRDRLRDALAD
jgi:hypothetical protein